MYKIIHIDATGTRDSYKAGDPTPGRGANEFATRAEAETAIESLDAPGNESEWRVAES